MDNKLSENIDDQRNEENNVNVVDVKINRIRNSNTKYNLKNRIKRENSNYYDITNMKNNENEQIDISKTEENNNDFDLEISKNENEENKNEENKNEEINLLFVKNKPNYNRNFNDIINIGSSNETGLETEQSDNIILRKNNNESSLSYYSMHNKVKCKIEESNGIENISNTECENDMNIKNTEKCDEENNATIKDDNGVDVGKSGIKNEGNVIRARQRFDSRLLRL